MGNGEWECRCVKESCVVLVCLFWCCYHAIPWLLWAGGAVVVLLVVMWQSYRIAYATVDTLVSWSFDVVRISSCLSQIKYQLEGIFSFLIPEYRRKRFRLVSCIKTAFQGDSSKWHIGSDKVQQKIELLVSLRQFLPKISGSANYRRAFVLGPNNYEKDQTMNMILLIYLFIV